MVVLKYVCGGSFILVGAVCLVAAPMMPKDREAIGIAVAGLFLGMLGARIVLE